MAHARPRPARSRRRTGKRDTPRAEATAASGVPTRRDLLHMLGAMLVLYGLYYFPYARGSWADRFIFEYVKLQACLAAAVIQLFDSNARLTDNRIVGRFALEVIKDCSSLDAQAVLVAAVLAFRARWQLRALGCLAGVLLLNLANVLRIASLYFVGLYAPARFDATHEELMPLLLIACACAFFVAWMRWALPRSEVSHALV